VAGLAAELRGAPANDNFANRAPLAGDRIVFSGDLTGATLEMNEPTNVPPPMFLNSPMTNSVWWTWTASASVPVIISLVSCSEDSYVPTLGAMGGYAKDFSCVLAVYSGADPFVNPNRVAAIWVNPQMSQPSASFQAVAGTTYQIQFFGAHPTMQATFQLVATNGPIILDGPTPQTVFPNGSALFTVLAEGIPPLSYQWRSNGVDIVGQTGPMLALAYVQPGQQGAYSVVVSNASGVVESPAANLSVNANPLRPLLGPASWVGSNAVAFTLTGEAGRYYRVQASSNLATWTTVSNFPARMPLLTYPPTAVNFRSVVYCTNATISLVVTNAAGGAFYRASLYSPKDEFCEMHLKQIRFAKQLWQRAGNQARNATPHYLDLEKYWPDIEAASCPLLGNSGVFQASYQISDMTTDPLCYVDRYGHVLQEP
jgi:hypothetical protein